MSQPHAHRHYGRYQDQNEERELRKFIDHLAEPSNPIQSENEAGGNRKECDRCQYEDQVSHGSPPLLLVIALIASELLWPDEGVEEVDKETEGEQRN
jgi:hypothetical protein